jgi:hypothetical protein
MATARFQVVSVARSLAVPAQCELGVGAGSWAETPHRRVGEFTWRFMSANNRSLARSAHTSPDLESCLQDIRTLQRGLPFAIAETSRDGHRQWVWRLRLAGIVVATAARSYPRQVRARITCSAFVHLAAETVSSGAVQVRYR